jgi:hypothetical protein
MLATHSGRLREARRNDVQEAEMISGALIADVLHLQEISERRDETVEQLRALRSTASKHASALADTIRREQEIDNVRLHPLLTSITAQVRADLRVLKLRDDSWDKVYDKKAKLDAIVGAVAAERDKGGAGAGSGGPADVASITAAIEEDAALLIQLSSAVRVLQSVSTTEHCRSDPAVQESLARAKDAVTSIALKRIALLERSLDVGKDAAAAKDDSSSAIAIETALIGVMAARAGNFVDVSVLESANPGGRPPRIILLEAQTYLQVSCVESSRFPPSSRGLFLGFGCKVRCGLFLRTYSPVCFPPAPPPPL